jgi:hypothetical protein
MGKPDPPTPPNPFQTAAAATGTNVSTAVANAFLNNTNQTTPTGTLNYDVTGNYGWTDPTTGSTYNIPRFTASQALTPEGQNIQNQTLGAQQNLATMANEQSGNVRNLLNTAFNPNATAPSPGDPSRISNVPAASTSFSPGGQVQSGLDTSGLANSGNIQTSYGPGDNFSADRQNVQNALMARINPQLDIQRNQLQQQLADQGIRYGSQAYNNAFTPFNQQVNDAQFAAINQAGQEQQRMTQEAGALGAFQNAAQAQAYQQALGAGGFANQAQGQQFQQNAAQATFGNAGLAQQLAQQQSAFNAAQTGRNQYMQEAYQQRNQPINEISALLSGSQLQQPNWLNTPTSQIPTTDVAGLINNQFNQQLGVYQQQNQNYQSLKLSDERMKENITPMASVFASGPDGERKQLPIYEYSYKGDPGEQRHVGPMAQDVEKVDKDAVSEHGGVKYIHPSKVMGSILRAA